MEVYLHIESRKLEGYRLPDIPMTADGQPILPRKGEVLLINNRALIVTEIVWFLDRDPDKSRVAVYAKDADELGEGLDVFHYEHSNDCPICKEK